MRQHDRLGELYFRSAEGLADAVGFAHRVGIDQRDIQASGMAERQKGLVQKGETGGNGAPVSTAADDQDVDGPLEQLRIRLNC